MRKFRTQIVFYCLTVQYISYYNLFTFWRQNEKFRPGKKWEKSFKQARVITY